ncbi:MAG: class I SAM-dependent methyltransferase [Clostridia bacterium]|nr:class I SAM-dependent methyltransferase [Clostridia bacterium]
MSDPKLAFNSVPALYDRCRPVYPDEVYEDIFAYMNTPASDAVCLEIGIGTGQATRPVLLSGASVTAVEIGADLAAYTQNKYAEYPALSVVNCAFEDFTGTENGFDLIYSASAFHWIPEEVGYPKVYSLLRPGGVFARFANHPSPDKRRPKLCDAIQELYAIYMPGSHPAGEYTDDMAANRAAIAEKYGFVDISHHLYYGRRDFTAAAYTALLGTYSDHLAIPEPRRTEFFAAIEDTINAHGGTFTVYDTVDLQLAKKMS